LELELLDGDGKIAETKHTSGGRAESEATCYTLFAAEPQPAPARVRIRYNEPGFAPFERTYTWAQARSGNSFLPLKLAGPLRGRVVDEHTGAPVAGAEIRIGEALAGNRTDEQGRFEFQSHDPLLDFVNVLTAGYEPRQTPVAWPPSDDWTIKLAPGGHVLRGRVLSADGQPLEGAVIRAYTTGRNLSLTTDAEGRFEVIGLPTSRNALYPTVAHAEYVAKDGFNLPLDSDGVTEVEWRLEKGAVVTGRVTAKADGQPVAGIVVTSGNDRFGSNRVNPEAVTDAEGRYRLAGIKPGPALVHVFDSGFAPATQQVTASLSDPVSVDFELVAGKPITGRITEPDGKPVSGATLAVDTWNGARMFDRRVNTNANGEFRFENMPSTPAEIHIFKRDYVSKRDLQAVGGEHYDITLLPVTEHAVKVRLADSDAIPAAVTIQKGYQWSGREEIHWNDVQDYETEAKYDPAAGLVRIRVDEPSSNARLFWRLRVPGYRDTTIENPEIGAKPQALEAVLERVQSVAGNVVSAETGEPMEGVMVALVSKQDRLRLDHYVEFDSSYRALEEFTGVHATSAANGSFELPEVGDGAEAVDLLLLRKGDGFHYIRDARSLLAGGAVDLPLPKAGAVEGQVIVAGEPVAGSEVHLAWMAPGEEPHSYDLPFGFGGQVTTDADGQFRYTGLGPGRYRLSRIRSFKNPLGGGSMSAYLSGDEIVVLPGETVTHNFNQPAGHTLIGETVNSDGKPLNNCMVSVSKANELTGRVDAVMSDADGRFTIEHLQPGTYALRAEQYEMSPGAGLGRDSGYGTATVKVAGDTTITIKLAPRTQAQGGRVGAGGQATLVGSVPPDFTGKLFDADGSFTLSDHFGKVIAIDFWATWCGPCMAVMPQMKELHEKYKDSEEVLFITVSLDQDAEPLRKVVKEQGIAFPVIYENREASQEIANAFGASGIPASFVIGRDGRFASERVHGSQLLAATEAAVKAPRDPAFAEEVKPARLLIKLALDSKDLGLPGATIKLKAIAADGKIAREETIRTPGQTKQLTWLYPPLDGGGEIEVTVEADGMPAQERIVLEPETKAEVSFRFTSPRTISGSVLADDGTTPVPNMKVTAYRQDGFRRETITGADGKFHLGVLPGTYYLIPVGSEDFAPIGASREQLEVQAERDPEPVELTACRTVSVTGTVTDVDGAPVTGADVRTGASEKGVKTDDAGRFELKGVPSQGSVQLYAMKPPKYAMVTLEDFAGKEPQQLVLGQQAGRSASLAAGGKAPPLKVRELDGGTPREWQPPADQETLVLFCALWHPSTPDLLARAKAWADEHQAKLALMSIDWSLEQARRGAESLQDADDYEIHFAGPGGLEIAQAWNLKSLTQAYLVSPDGKIRRSPPPGELPVGLRIKKRD
jgi:protocatechuate 3,4-dioxygenase beta subunit/thiol-disulfide isomerase/thioredoxin